MFKKTFLKSFILLASLGVLSTGCSSGDSSPASGGSDGGSTGSYVNISGKVTTSGGSSKLSKFGLPSFSAESGCTVKAYDVDSDNAATVVATGTTDASGNYTLKDGTLENGGTYKVIAECGSNKYASVASAVTNDPTELDDDERVSTNPRSTIIAAQIVKAIEEAVESATSGLSASVKTAVKQAIFSALDSIIQTVAATIEEAIESGAMEEPSQSDSTSIASAVKDADDAGDIDTAIGGTSVQVPVSVDGAVSGAAVSVVANSACDSTKGGSLDKCTRSVAKLMYRMLNFPIAILKDGSGAYDADNSNGALTNCNASQAIGDLAASTSTLGAEFPDAEFMEGAASGGMISADYCVIMPKFGRPNRNRGFEKGGDDGGPLFAETGDMDGGGSIAGVLTEIGTALYNGYTYKLADIDKIIFTRSGNAGMNNRLINIREVATNGQAPVKQYFYFNGTSWTNASWPANCGSGSDVCSPWDLNFNFGTEFDWTSDSGGNSSLSTAIGASNIATSQGILVKKFGGPVPTQNELNRSIDEEKINLGWNPTGEKEFIVVVSKPQGFSSDGSSPCWDNDSSTACLDIDGDPIAPVRVNVTFSAVQADKRKYITAINKSSTGEYYMRPMWGPTGFSGVVGFVNASTGRILVDEFFKERGVKIAFNGGDCTSIDNSSSDLDTASCTTDDVFNVDLDWSSCQGPDSPCPGYELSYANKITGDLGLEVHADFRQNWYHYGTVGHPLVGIGDWNNFTHFKYTVSGGAGTDALAYAGTGIASAGGQYNAALWMDCSTPNEPCAPDGFLLIDQNGTPRTTTDDADAANTVSVDFGSGPQTAVKYLIADLDGAGDYDSVAGGTQTFSDVATNYYIFDGPVANPNFQCDKEPYFIDGNSNGQLDCGISNGVSVATGGDVSFSGPWEYQNWLMQPGNNSSAQVLTHLNGYAWGDPVGTKKLLSNAFNGWFDGTHTISTTTNFNALQAFALIFMFFTEGDGDGGTSIDGLVTGYDRFESIEPTSNESVGGINQAIGEGIKNFRQ